MHPLPSVTLLAAATLGAASEGEGDSVGAPGQGLASTDARDVLAPGCGL